MKQQQNYITSKGEFGQNLRYIREMRGLKQEDVAKLLHNERSTYSCYELGKSLPSILALIQLAEIFDVDIHWFLTDGIETRFRRALKLDI